MKPGKHQRKKQRCQDLCWKVQDLTKTFRLVSSLVSSKRLLCFVHGQGQKKEQKHITKNLGEFRNHSPLLTVITRFA